MPMKWIIHQPVLKKLIFFEKFSFSISMVPLLSWKFKIFAAYSNATTFGKNVKLQGA